MGHQRFTGPHEPILSPPRDFKLISKQHEISLGIAHALAHGGQLPSDPWWHYLQYRRDLATFEGHHARFAFYHPRLFGLLDRDAVLRAQQDLACPYVSLLPNTPDWRYLEYRYEVAPTRFAHNHAPGLVKLLAEDAAYRAAQPPCMTEMPSSPSTYVPPPSIAVATPSPGTPSSIAVATPSPGTPSAQELATPAPASAILMAFGLAGGLLLGRWMKQRRGLKLRRLPQGA